jgi:REP element-mobilizing transposase RayT
VICVNTTDICADIDVICVNTIDICADIDVICAYIDIICAYTIDICADIDVKPRDLHENAMIEPMYHITSEIDRNEMYLQLAESKDMFLTYINKAKQKYPFQLLNHIHLLIKPEQGQRLSTIMKCLKGNFARYWNKVDKKSGHLWGKRFFSKIITDVSQFLNVFKYIDKNPMGRCTDGDTLNSCAEP